ncbi:hypothetical protein QJS04_geneDACA004184 [Acorus gramineus]|uniref:Prostaglandin E synthase 2 n=1 Tax=Acorus gramineus TaxID=55184 RepID=A0AAV9BLC3_ACOGR|nr:hypothetical protein QJS04_geneDACA004184 [Acorus gramineus]
MMWRGLQRSWMVVGRRLFNGLENRSTLLTPRLIPYSSDVLHGSRFIYPTSHRINDTLNGVGVAAAFRSYSAVAERIIKDDDSPIPIPIPPPSSSSLQPIKEIILYQYAACPFCNKVKAFLDFYDLPYKLVEVNPINKKEIIWSDYKKVPILVVDGEQLSDSTETEPSFCASNYSEIISTLYQRLSPTSDDLSGTRDAEEEKWRRTPLEALESFDYITTKGNFTRLERWTGKYAGATAMYFVSKKLKKRHNIQDERKALYDAVETWIGGLSDRLFMGGARPNLADLAVFGVLRPIRHLQAGRDLIANTKIRAWYDRVETLVGESSENRGV